MEKTLELYSVIHTVVKKVDCSVNISVIYGYVDGEIVQCKEKRNIFGKIVQKDGFYILKNDGFNHYIGSTYYDAFNVAWNKPCVKIRFNHNYHIRTTMGDMGINYPNKYYFDDDKTAVYFAKEVKERLNEKIFKKIHKQSTFEGKMFYDVMDDYLENIYNEFKTKKEK